ncbi:hypothetical protein FRB95_014282 [Tulasnella sp. JGI-2019a]|nr:hypothetical protein FRB95_014282 [Tulasnella sp. JGI-2019a]
MSLAQRMDGQLQQSIADNPAYNWNIMPGLSVTSISDVNQFMETSGWMPYWQSQPEHERDILTEIASIGCVWSLAWSVVINVMQAWWETTCCSFDHTNMFLCHLINTSHLHAKYLADPFGQLDTKGAFFYYTCLASGLVLLVIIHVHHKFNFSITISADLEESVNTFIKLAQKQHHGFTTSLRLDSDGVSGVYPEDALDLETSEDVPKEADDEFEGEDSDGEDESKLIQSEDQGQEEGQTQEKQGDIDPGVQYRHPVQQPMSEDVSLQDALLKVLMALYQYPGGSNAMSHPVHLYMIIKSFKGDGQVLQPLDISSCMAALQYTARLTFFSATRSYCATNQNQDHDTMFQDIYRKYTTQGSLNTEFCFLCEYI